MARNNFIVTTGIYNSNLNYIIDDVIDNCSDNPNPAYSNVRFAIKDEIASDNEFILRITYNTGFPSVMSRYDTPSSVKRWLASRIKKMTVFNAETLIHWNEAYKALKKGVINHEFDSDTTEFYGPHDYVFSLNEILFVYMQLRSEWPNSLTVPDMFSGVALDSVTTELIDAHKANLKDLNDQQINETNAITQQYERQLEDLRAWRDQQFNAINVKFAAAKNDANEKFDATMKTLGLHVVSLRYNED